nr:integrin alpha-D-like [Pelodiscus sinensis]|eukprot:XP_025038902.1 integrin alpha-D-like [Pelodiscus sinensis]
MKTFLSEIMKSFRSTDTQFALMQYSNKFKEHFNFTEYRRNRDLNVLVQGIEKIHGTTHTASAIRKVVRELFTSESGAREEATKVLIVITDGQKNEDPLSYSDVIPEVERAGIIRYAVGDCSVATCKKIRCTITSLEIQQPLEFMIKGNVGFQWVSQVRELPLPSGQTLQQKVTLVSEARIEYEEKKYTKMEGFVQRQPRDTVSNTQMNSSSAVASSLIER